jgi:hypothetical protein
MWIHPGFRMLSQNKCGRFPLEYKPIEHFRPFAMRTGLATTALLPFLLSVLPINGAVTPQSLSLPSANSSIVFTQMNPSRCTSIPDWIGNGIIDSDCQAAMNELYWDDVEPRRGQKYEFLKRGVRRVSDLPWVTTPRKHSYGVSPPEPLKGLGIEILMFDRDVHRCHYHAQRVPSCVPTGRTVESA